MFSSAKLICFDAEIGSLQMYPNPASKHINFALENILTRAYTYKIIDQRGVTVQEGALNRDLTTPQRVDLTSLSNGVYFVQIKVSDKSVIYRKIVVMNRH